MHPELHEPPDAPSARGLLGLVGWIFADTLLVLVVVFLATQTGGAVTPRAVARSSAPPSESPTPQTTSQSPEPPPGVDSDFVCFRINTDPALLTGAPSAARHAQLADLQRRLTERISQPDLAGRKAGIVLSFGVADSPDAGVKLAAAFNAAILPRVPAMFRSADATLVANRAFWGGRPREDRRSGSIELDIYPIIDATYGPLGRPDAKSC